MVRRVTIEMNTLNVLLEAVNGDQIHDTRSPFVPFCYGEQEEQKQKEETCSPNSHEPVFVCIMLFENGWPVNFQGNP